MYTHTHTHNVVKKLEQDLICGRTEYSLSGTDKTC